MVRVAPRQKSTTSATTSPTTITSTATTISSTNQSPSIVSGLAAPTYCYNLAHSFPASNPSHNTTITNTNNPLHTSYPHFVHMNQSNASGTGTLNASSHSSYQPGVGGAIDLNDSLKSTASAMMPNPFLAKRPKSLNHCRRDRPLIVRPAPSSPPPPPPPALPASAPHPYNTLTLPYSRSMAMHCTMDKKFNSLKTSTARKKPEFYSLRVSKCRRHHSLANPTYDMQQKLLVINNTLLPYAKRFNQATATANHSDSEHEQHKHHHQLQSPAIRHSRFNCQPLYENLVNSVHNVDPNVASAYDEYYCDANDANSMYRSDSGISNSSFELTPIPAPRNNPRNCQSAPVYVNLPKYVANSALLNKKHGAITTAFNYEVCVSLSLHARSSLLTTLPSPPRSRLLLTASPNRRHAASHFYSIDTYPPSIFRATSNTKQ